MRLFDFLCRLWVAAMLALFVLLYIIQAAACYFGGGYVSSRYWSDMLGP